MKLGIALSAVLLVTVVGCGDDGGTNPKPPDAAIAGDAPILIDAPTTVDMPSGNACTGAAYDPCTDNTQCMSNQCRVFGSAGLQVCTQDCNAGMPCPDQNGQPVQCNGMGRCRPDVANTCTR